MLTELNEAKKTKKKVSKRKDPKRMKAGKKAFMKRTKATKTGGKARLKQTKAAKRSRMLNRKMAAKLNKGTFMQGPKIKKGRWKEGAAAVCAAITTAKNVSMSPKCKWKKGVKGGGLSARCKEAKNTAFSGRLRSICRLRGSGGAAPAKAMKAGGRKGKK